VTRIPATLLLSLAACSSGPGPAGGTDVEPAEKVSIATATGGGYEVEILADAKLQVGLNDLHLRVTTSGAPVTDATVAFLPLATTSGGARRCPVMGTGLSSPDGLYQLGVVLDGATADGNAWSADVEVAAGGATATVSFAALTVVAGKDLARSFESGATRYVMALEFQGALRVGLDPIVVTLHETEDGGMTYAPVDDATLSLDPQMPSMGHGASGSVDPVVTGEGWYEGKVAFSMPGDWLTTITVARGDAVIGAPGFLVYF
jgi:hypothetical protein